MTDVVSSTEVFWDVDGVSLQSYAWNIVSWGGTRQSPPALRGDDVLVPYIEGQLWTPKVSDSRTITLSMWVIGAEDDGTIPYDRQWEFERNWAKLKRLLWNPYRQVRLTKRWYEGERLMVATGMAEFAGGLEPEITGQQRAVFTVDLHMADPFFYSPAIEGYRWTTAAPKQFIRGLGDVKTRQVVLRFHGPLNSPSLASPSGEGIGYYGLIAAGQVVTVNVALWQAQRYTPAAYEVRGGDMLVETSPATTDRVPANIVWAGDRHWLQLEPFEDELTLTAYTGSDGGWVEADVIPTWI